MNPLVDVAVLTRRAVRRTLRSRDVLLVSLALPVLMMALFVYVFGGALDVGMRYVDYVVPGIILLCTGFGASVTATAVAADVRGGSIDRFRTLPVPRFAVVAGHVGEGLLRNLLAVATVLMVAVGFGFRSGAGVSGWAVAVLVIVAWVHAVTWLAVAIGLVASGPEAAGGLTYAIMFLPYVSGAFVRTSSMPSWLRGFADHQPATPVVGTIRDCLTGVAPDGRAVVALAWCVGLAVVGWAATVALFERRTRE